VSEHDVIYIIGSPSAGPLKIGVSRRDVKDRLAEIQTGSPARLAILHSESVPKGRATGIERRAHLALKDSRLVGEWFSVDLRQACNVVSEIVKVAMAEPESIRHQPHTVRVPVVPTFTVSQPLVHRVTIDEKIAMDERIQWKKDAPKRALVARLAEGKKRKAAKLRSDMARLQDWINGQ
jgi:hypothetical protein